MKKHLITLALAVSAILPASATQFILEDFEVTLKDSSAQPWDGVFDGNIQLGKFTDGFTPTLANTSTWLANWSTGVNGGYYDSSGPEWSAHLLLNNNDTFAVGQQLSLWVFDSQTTGSEWAVYTDPTWLVTSSSGIDPTNHFFSFTASTVARFGTFDFVDKIASTASTTASAIPEPSTYAALAGLGALGLAVYRRKAKRLA